MNNEYHLPSEELIIPTGMIMAVHAMADPNRMALVTREKTMTYQELNSRVNQLARALRKRGVMPEDSIAVLLKNRAEFIEVLYANARIGTRFTPINWHLSAAEVGYILDNCDAKVIITEADLKDTCIEALQDNTKAKIKVLIDDTDDAFEAYESLLEGEETSNIDEPIPGKAMLYTSGTTGHPKGVYRKTPPKVNAIQLQLIATGAYNPGNDVFYSPGPLYHSSPLAIGILLHITVGATIIVTQKWDAHEALKLMHKYKVTHINVVPYHMQSLLKLDDDIKKQYNVSHLRWMFHTGAPCPRHIKQDLMAWLGPVIYEMYAGTEGVFTIVSPKEWLEHPGTVGKPDPSVGLTILNDDGEELPAGEIGYIYANTEDLGRFEYYKDEEKTQKTYRGNLFSLGDKGYLDAEGYLYITGRTADLVLSGGVNIYPAEVDAAMIKHPAVHDVCNFGIPNEEYGEEIRAVVQLENGYSPSDDLAREIIDFTREHIAHYKCPKTLVFTSNLPRSEAGKLPRAVIRDRFMPDDLKDVA